MKIKILLLLVLITLTGCTQKNESSLNEPDQTDQITLADLPNPENLFYPTSTDHREPTMIFKQSTSSGFHLGEEYNYQLDELNTYAIADGQIVYRNWIADLGGVIILQHQIAGQVVQSIYGHINLDQTNQRLNDFVRAGTLLGTLNSEEPSIPFYFGIYPGSNLQLKRYSATFNETDNWINPSEFFSAHQASNPDIKIQTPQDWDTKNLVDVHENFNASLSSPNDWNIEFNQENNIIKFFTGDQSHLLISTYQAEDFQTLSNLTIHSRYFRDINDHSAIDYELEKQYWSEDFANQPQWRNERHQVTAIRESDLSNVFYEFAVNPNLDEKTLYYVLHSLMFRE